jgi:hypothetical protein
LQTRRAALKETALADPRARRELDELEAAFASYLDEDTVVPAIEADPDRLRLDVAPPAPEVKALVFHRGTPTEMTHE